jgi:type IV pilus assembly protein PilV
MLIAKPHRDAHPDQSGFTLLEVMVSLLIISVGLLGIAKLQALSYASSGSANLRSLVAMQTSGLAASMHADRGYWAGLAPATQTITGATVNDGTLGPLTATCTSAANGAPCSPTALAGADLHAWATALNNMLLNSSPVTTIACPTGNIPITCTIKVTWSERAVGINDQGVQGTTATNFLPTYTLYVEP